MSRRNNKNDSRRFRSLSSLGLIANDRSMAHFAGTTLLCPGIGHAIEVPMARIIGTSPAPPHPTFAGRGTPDHFRIVRDPLITRKRFSRTKFQHPGLVWHLLL